MRLRGTDVSVLEEEGLDSEGAVTSKSKLQSKVKALSGVDILTATGEYKSTYEILLQISEVWEDISDIDQAALLELISGKRNSSVVAAILQNPKELKDAYEDAMNASGSALAENEKYLDSIQGKIDQFNNAVQSMWSNTLNSDMVKGIVQLGTEIIKIIDKIGLLNSALIALATISMIKNKMGPIEFFGGISDGIRNVVGKIGGFIGSMTGATAATSAYTAETLSASVANGALSASEAASIASKNGLALATTNLTAAEAAEMLMKSGIAQADALAMVTKLGLTSTTQALSLAEINAAVSSGVLTAAQGAQIASAFGLTVANTGLAASFMALWTAMWPILAVMAAFAAISFVVANFDEWTRSSSYLREEISDLKAELEDLESDIDDINTELQTTHDRMAELIAMPSLSFVEQEELQRLEALTKELEHQKELKETMAEATKANLDRTQKEYIDNVWESEEWFDTYAVDWWTGEIIERPWWMAGTDTKQAIGYSLSRYKGLEDDVTSSEDILKNWEKYSDDEKRAALISLRANRGGVVNPYEYLNPDQETLAEEIEIARANMNKISTGILSVYGDENFADLENMPKDFLPSLIRSQMALGKYDTADAIQKIVNVNGEDLSEEVSKIMSDSSLDREAKLNQVNKLIDESVKKNEDLRYSLEYVFGDLEDGEELLRRYYTQMSELPDSSTVEGVAKQYQAGTEALIKYSEANKDANAVIAEYHDALSGQTEQITWGSLFDDETGEPIDTQISKILKGADETARKEFASLAKAVNEGKTDVENAISHFSLSGVKAGYQLLEGAIIDINSDIFKDLGDEISGLIDTFNEFGLALESVASSIDLVNQAQAEMEYSGHLSVETALDLISSTEDWNKVLKIENGNITLVDGAMNILAQSKLDQIKTNLQLALSEAQAGLEQAKLAESGGEVAKTLEESTTESVRQLAANMEYLSTLVGEFLAGNYRGAGSAAASAKANSLRATEYQKTSTTSSISVADWEKKVSDIEAKIGMLESVDTTEEFLSNYSSDDVSGGNNTKEGATKSKLDEQMEEFQGEMDYWENRIAANQAKYGQLQNEIDLMEQKGQKADVSFYEKQIELENERKTLLEGQKAAAKAHLDTLEEGSEEWWEVANVLNDVEGELDDVTASIVELQDTIGDIDAYKFEEFNKRLDNLTDKLETVRSLIAPNGEEDWFDDEGNWTDGGIGVLGTYVQDLEFFKQGYQNTMDELAKYKSPYAGNESYYEKLGIHSEQEYYDKVEELTDEQYKFAESISDTEQSIVDMYESSIDATEKYIETLINGYNDYIDSVKEALDAERDLYNFKKNVQKQSKDIAELERRIASLSGSTNKADVAERRKLEAQLYESRETLNDTYYDHAKDAQSEALDAEQSAYEEAMTKMVEGMRTSLEEATRDMESFLNSVTIAVSMNADTILKKYQDTNVYLDPALTNPWNNAKDAVGKYGTDANNLMDVWKKDGYFAKFKLEAGTNLSSPWNDGTTAANAFKTSVDTTMDEVVKKIDTNVQSAATKLSNLYQQIIDTEQRAKDANVDVGSLDDSTQYGVSDAYTTYISESTPEPKLRGLMQTSKEIILGSTSFVEANTETIDGVKYYRDSNTGYYYKISDLNSKRKYDGGRTTGWAIPKGTWFYTKHAKGTRGTKRDEWAITDEPWLGDELTMYATPEGTLSYMRAGSTVVPADLTRELMDMAELGVDGLVNMPKFNSGVTVISNAINSPEINLSFDALVKADRIDEGTLPEVKKFVQQEINTLVKQMNYAIKGKGGR